MPEDERGGVQRVVVVGGGAAGMSAASAARRTDREAEITVLEAGPFTSYGVCGLPYYISGAVAEAETLIAYPASEFRDRRRIDLRLGTRVETVDLGARSVLDSHGERHPFDSLVLAVGARPIIPAVDGVDDPRVVTVRRLEDAIELRKRLTAGSIGSAVVMGAGYVGLEMAEALCESGVEVTVIDRLPRVLTTVDASVAEVVEQELRRRCRVELGRELVAIDRAPSGLLVEAGGSSFQADLVVLALGVRPAGDLVEGAASLPNGALIVDEAMRTSLQGVFAAGDCVALPHRVLNAPAYIPLGPAANRTGRVAGVVAAGGQARFDGVVGTAVVKVFDLCVAHTGLTLEEATARGFDARAADVAAKSRAKYYPGAEPLLVRLVHEPDGRLLGAQMVGKDGVAHRIDVMAAALYAGMGIEDLASLDLAYAPPYSPVYDPIIQAAQAASLARERTPA